MKQKIQVGTTTTLQQQRLPLYTVRKRKHSPDRKKNMRNTWESQKAFAYEYFKE